MLVWVRLPGASAPTWPPRAPAASFRMRGRASFSSRCRSHCSADGWVRMARTCQTSSSPARDLHTRPARGAAARRGGRSLRTPWPARTPAGSRRGRSIAPQAGARGDRCRARAARGGFRPAAREVVEPLIARLLAHGARRGRSLRTLSLSARLAAGGGWRRQVALRRASADRSRLADALLPHLTLLPAPAATLRLEAVALGPETGEQLSLSSPEEERRRRISEAVSQTRSAAGADSLLRVLEVDPESRVPERREVLMPWSAGLAPQAKPRSNPS